MASNIRLAVANNNIIRILPNLDEFYNEWITNKTRFIYDSFNIQRLYYPKIKLYYKFIILSWKLILLIYINLLLKNFYKFINIICGNFMSLELSMVLKNFYLSFGCNNINYHELTKIIPHFRFSYLLNYSLININKLSSIILIGTNPRLEAPLYNIYLRKYLKNNNKFKIYSIGLGFDYISYNIINLGNSLNNLLNIINGINLVIKYFLFDNFYNYLIFNINQYITINFLLGNSIINRLDSQNIFNMFLYFSFKLKLKNNINILQRHLGRIITLK